MKWMIKNSAGEQDGIWTLAVIAFFITTLVVLASMVSSVDVGFFSAELSDPNVPLVTLYFGGAFTSYVIRRNAKLRAPEDKKEE